MAPDLVRDDCPIHTEHNDSLEAVLDFGNKVRHARSLELPASYPHHVRLTTKCSRSGVRVGGLRVVDPLGPTCVGHHLAAVSLDGKGRQRRGDRLRARAGGGGHRGAGGGVGNTGGAGRADALRAGEWGGVVGQHAVSNAHNVIDLRGHGFARGVCPAIRAQSATGSRKVHDGGIVERQHWIARSQDLCLVFGVGAEATVPVKVILGEVEHAADIRGEGRRPVQLEARNLGDEHIRARLAAVFRRQSNTGRSADIAHRLSSPAVCHHHGGQHGGRGGLAVGSRHGEPLARRAECPRLVGEPRGFDIADDGDALVCGCDEQLGSWAPTGRGDHDRGTGVSTVETVETRNGVGDRHVCVRSMIVGDDDVAGIESIQHRHHAAASHAQPSDEHGLRSHDVYGFVWA